MKRSKSKIAPRKRSTSAIASETTTPQSAVQPAPEETVLVLRTCDKDLKSHGGFQWPASGPVSAPDWRPEPRCGKGLHGLLDAWGNWGLLDWSENAKALVVRVARASLVDLGDKVKFPSGVVEKVTSLASAICEIACDSSRVARLVADTMALVGFVSGKLAASGNASKLAASGNASQLAASGNDSKLAASGNASKLAASGDDSQLAASGNDSKLAASGYASKLAASGDASQLAASGDASKLAASGNASVVLAAGYRSVAKAGPNGALALAWWDGKRPRIVVGYVGEGIEADTFYRVNERGELAKA
jgi:hypothetical protein